jgi:hypothetical protein
LKIRLNLTNIKKPPKPFLAARELQALIEIMKLARSHFDERFPKMNNFNSVKAVDNFKSSCTS